MIDHDATHQLAALRSGAISASELMAETLDRIDRVNPGGDADLLEIVGHDLRRGMRALHFAGVHMADGNLQPGQLFRQPMRLRDSRRIIRLCATR